MRFFTPCFTQFFTHGVPLLFKQVHTRYYLRIIPLYFPPFIRLVLTRDHMCFHLQLDTRVLTLIFRPVTTPTEPRYLTRSSRPVRTLASTPKPTPNCQPCLIRLTPSHPTRLLTQIYLRFTPRGIQQVVQESC